MEITCPKYLFNKLSSDFPYNTRLAHLDSVRMGEAFKTKLELTERSFMNRATVNFNQIPTELRQTANIDDFKKKMKVWVIENCKL
jgi:hypothetical protein